MVDMKEKLGNLVSGMEAQLNNEMQELETGIFGSCISCKEMVVGMNNGCNALGNLWHTNCFTCADCNKTLFDAGGFFEKKGKVYCEEHYLARVAPRCAKCSQAITDEIVRTQDSTYHPECFKCAGCEVALQDKPFIPKDGSPYCRVCWHKEHGVHCAKCDKAIVPEGYTEEARCMKAIDKTFHIACFSCTECDEPFTTGEKKGAYPIEGRLYCYNHALKKAQENAMKQKAANQNANN